jgi:NAD(P)-dependent dehydrogenase (short-subunit alcohol dehydrogenase family)
MKRQRSGAIVNVTSIYGDRGFPNSALYVASKHAVIGLTGTAALEAAPFGVRVNAIGPGYIDTAMYARRPCRRCLLPRTPCPPTGPRPAPP